MDRFLPLITITLGDPAGVGPEIILKAAQSDSLTSVCRPVVIGDMRILKRAASWLDRPDAVSLREIARPDQAVAETGTLCVLSVPNAPPEEIVPGCGCAAAGKAAVEYVHRACDLALAGQVQGIVTGPLNKEVIQQCGMRYTGHTDLIAKYIKCEHPAIMLLSPKLRVVLLSNHLPLREAMRHVNRSRINEVLGYASEACRSLGIENPHIAVSALNPHAGEDGLFGDEERREILPAIQAARARNLRVSGPIPADTVFLRAYRGEFDIVIAAYHDQAHMAFKFLAPESGVNVSLGFPFVRTSVLHGTAYRRAGSGSAREDNLLAAARTAAELAQARADATVTETAPSGNRLSRI